MTLISRGSLARLAEQAERPGVDSRRFRMLIEVDGIGAHEEDRWVGRRVRVGEAVAMRPRACRPLRDHQSASRNWGDRPPDAQDPGHVPTEADTTEPVAFGIYGEVLQPGTVSVGDAVSVDRG